MYAISGRRQTLRAQALGLLAVLCLLPPSAGADRVQVRASGAFHPDTNAFDLHVVREDLEADYDDTDATEILRLRRVGISFHENLNDSIRIGVRLGYAGFTQSGRASTAGFDPTGYFGELDLEGGWPANSRFRAALGASWRYTSVDTADETTEVSLDWQTLELRPGLRAALTPKLQLMLGVSATAVDGSERVTGTTRTTTDFSEEKGEGAFAILEYHRDDRDVVALRLRSGNPQGLYFAFEHRFRY